MTTIVSQKTEDSRAVWMVYVLRCADDSLYCGITNNLTKRFMVHSAGKGAKYTRGRGPLSIVFVQLCRGKSAALKAEYAFKKLGRKQKDLIMAKKELSQYQKGVVKRYYEHKDDINSQRLGEIVTELYLANSEVNKKRLWITATNALLGLVEGKPKLKVRAEEIIKNKNLEELAKIVGELF